MVSGFICGTSSLPREDDDCERHCRSADSSPRRCRSSRSNKNPYSDRGLDKFSMLLAEIEERRQQIFSKVDPEEISLVRFVYSGDRDFKPIIVKAKQKPETTDKPGDKITEKALRKLPSSTSMSVAKDENKAETRSNHELKVKKKKGLYRTLKVYKWNEPKFYLPMIFILILALVVLFGRSFAIMCTSIGWYVIPAIRDNNSSNLRMSFKKKDYAERRLSSKKLMTSEGKTSFKRPEARP